MAEAMPEEIYDAMGAVLARWTMGSPGTPAASIWSAELGGDPGEAELRLLALSGQFLAVAVTVEVPATLRDLPDIPLLDLPTLPEALRPFLRRLLATAREARSRAELLHFLAARGWTAHPGDWMPAAGDEEVPDIYAPWRDWAEMAASPGAARQSADDGLSAESWEEYRPAARKAALADLRRQKPAEARALLEAKLANEGAETRLGLLGLLAAQLSEADIPFLEGIASADRAPKVKALASSLLARLGHASTAGEDAAELAGFFSLQKTDSLPRSITLQAQALKTPAQRQRRAALFESVDIASFAGVLGLTPEALVAAWRWDVDRPADMALIALVARTGTDAEVALTAEAVSDGDASGLHGLALLVPRLTPARRSGLAARLLQSRECRFEMARTIGGVGTRLDDPMAAPAGATLLVALNAEDAKPSDHLAELHALGLIASRAGAQRALERLTAAGLLQGDPPLDMLRLNAALEDRRADETGIRDEGATG